MASDSTGNESAKAGKCGIISLLVADRFGVLQRICGAFSRRGLNIASITVGRTEQEGLSRITIATSGDEARISQTIYQLDKIEDVRNVRVLGPDTIAYEALMAKVACGNSAERTDMLGLLGLFGGRVLSIRKGEIAFEMHGKPEDVDTFIGMIAEFHKKEFVRTGVTALELSRE